MSSSGSFCDLQERLFAWLGGLRASDICGGLLAKLSEHGMASQQRMKLEALRVRLTCCLSILISLPCSQRLWPNAGAEAGTGWACQMQPF